MTGQPRVSSRELASAAVASSTRADELGRTGHLKLAAGQHLDGQPHARRVDNCLGQARGQVTAWGA